MNSDPLVVIHQPDFIPYLGFFHRLLLADVWVVLDHVQLNREGWVHRDKIKTAYGIKWLTLPIQSAPLKTSINKILLANSNNWQEKHLNIIKDAYKKTPYFEEIFPHCQKLYALCPSNLYEFTMASLNMLLCLFDMQIKTIRSSEMEPKGKSNALVAELVVKAGGKRYLSGLGAKAYFDYEPYEKAGVSVIWQEFEHPVYPQLYGEFVPQLTSLDILFNCGIAESRKILRNLD